MDRIRIWVDVRFGFRIRARVGSRLGSGSVAPGLGEALVLSVRSGLGSGSITLGPLSGLGLSPYRLHTTRIVCAAAPPVRLGSTGTEPEREEYGCIGLCVCMRVCVCARARECVCACVSMCVHVRARETERERIVHVRD